MIRYLVRVIQEGLLSVLTLAKDAAIDAIPTPQEIVTQFQWICEGLVIRRTETRYQKTILRFGRICHWHVDHTHPQPLITNHPPE